MNYFLAQSEGCFFVCLKFVTVYGKRFLTSIKYCIVRLLMPFNQEIKGNTLKVYIYLIKNGPSDLRDIQRGLGLSSPSLASYHLGKLSEAGYASQNEQGQYFAQKEASYKILEGYSKVGSTVVPQLFFFALFFTIIGTFFSIQALFTEGFTLFLAITCVAMIIVFWYQTAKLWRRLTT